MSSENKLDIILAVVFGVVVFGMLAPALVSAKSDFKVLLGVGTMVGYGYFFYKRIYPLIVSKLNDEGENKDG